MDKDAYAHIEALRMRANMQEERIKRLEDALAGELDE